MCSAFIQALPPFPGRPDYRRYGQAYRYAQYYVGGKKLKCHVYGAQGGKRVQRQLHVVGRYAVDALYHGGHVLVRHCRRVLGYEISSVYELEVYELRHRH